jgi:ribonuclease HI
MYYVVYKGIKPGIYSNWKDCNDQIHGYSNAIYKKFKDLKLANQFLKTGKFELNENLIYDIKNVNIYVDGSCINNGKSANIKSGIGIFFGEDDCRNVSQSIFGKFLTNQRAELLAIKEAINIVKSDIDNNKNIIIYTDSNYSLKCLTCWCHIWKDNGWKIKSSKDKLIKNLDLIKPLYEYLFDHTNISFVHIRAHTGANDIHSINNKKADKLAFTAASK